MNVKRFGWVGAWLAACGVACAGMPGTLTIGMSQFPPDMHPNVSATSAKAYVEDMALRPMVSFDMAGNVICILCTEVPSLANGLAKAVDLPPGDKGGGKGMEVTFHLRSDLFWGDGVKVTAGDVAFAFKVEQTVGKTPDVTDVVAVDPHTVLMKLDATRYDYARLVPMPIAEHVEGKILAAAKTPLDYEHASAFNTDPTNPGLWDGPYRISKFVGNQSITLVPNPYWKGRKPAWQEIGTRLLENTATLEANALSGDIDMISSALGLTVNQAIGMRKDHPKGITYYFEPTLSYEHLTLNLDNPLLSDRRVRQALLMAIDRKTIVEKLFGGTQPVAQSFLEPSQFGWHKDTPTWNHDVAGAKRKLAEAGFKPGADGILVSPKGERFEITLVTTAGNVQRELVEQVLQTEFKAVGVQLDIKNEPARTMFGQTLRQRNFTGMVMFTSVPAPDSVPYYAFDSAMIPTAANNWFGQNYPGYQNPKMDAALEAARTELDAKKRYADWKTILDLYAEDLPELPLFFVAEPYIVPDTITGVLPPRMRAFAPMWIEDWRQAGGG